MTVESEKENTVKRPNLNIQVWRLYMYISEELCTYYERIFHIMKDFVHIMKESFIIWTSLSYYEG